METQPVKVGDIVKAKPEGKGNNGDPFFKIKGFVVFVKDIAEPGREYDFEITKVTNKVGFAKVHEQDGS